MAWLIQSEKDMTRYGFAYFGLILGALGALACVESEFEPPEPRTNNETVPDVEGARFGESCDEATPCREGLICEEGACAFEGGVAVDEPCEASAQCAEGLFCDALSSVCAPAGDAAEGEECGSESDCLPGLRCSLSGFSGACVSAGTLDVGSPCESTSECLAGLNCAPSALDPEGQTVCVAGPLGFPKPWSGVECAEDEGPFRAYFEVPDGADLPDFFRLPYPNDVRLVEGKPDLSGFPTPGDSLLGFDLVQRYVDAVEGYQEGFGLSPAVYLRFSAAPNFDTLSASGENRNIHLFNIDAESPEYGRRRGLRWSASTGRSNYVCQNQMMIRPNWSDPLNPETTYAFIITRGVRSEEGAGLEADEDFSAMLAAERPAGALGTAWDKHAKLRAWLADNEDAPAPEDVLFASVVTTGDPLKPVEALIAEAKTAEISLSEATLCEEGVVSPCEQGEPSRACGSSEAFHEVHGTVNLPIFQSGDAPYSEGGLATPGVKRSEDVCVAMSVPKSAAPETGWPVLIVAHGTGGNFRGHVDDFGDLLTSVEVDGETVEFVTIGWDQVLHANRRGESERHPNELVYNYANPAAALGNFLQGAAETSAIITFVEGLTFDAENSPTGEAIRLDPNNIWFLGHSQGGTTGPLALPFEDRVRGSVFSGAGAGLSLALLGKTSPVNSPAAVRLVLGESNAGDSHPAINLLQGYFDPVDPHNFARRMTNRFITDRTWRQHIFQPIGLGDTFTPPDTLRVMANSLQVTFADPLVEEWDVNTAPLPITANSSDFTVVGKQYTADGYDGHFVLFRNEAARNDLSIFLGTGALTGVPELR